MIIKKDWKPQTDALELRNHIDLILDQLDPRSEEKITCQECGQKHWPDEETFFTFYGNVTVGLNGGLIGNNFANDGTLARVSFHCRKEACLRTLFYNTLPAPGEDDEDIE
jgi:hypothetical protein